MADQASTTPEDLYSAVAAALAGESGVTHSPSTPGSKKFGSSALKINGRIFAMLVGGTLVLKLPGPRVDALIAAGEGRRFDPGHGRLMKEWVTVDPSLVDRWLPLATEAMAFLATNR